MKGALIVGLSLILIFGFNIAQAAERVVVCEELYQEG